MAKKIEKLFKSYRDQLLHLAKLYGVVEIKSYARIYGFVIYFVIF